MTYAVQVISEDMINVPSFMKIDVNVQELWPQIFEGLQYWFYWWQGFMKYAVEMGSGAMTYVPSLA
jgi:hypothetical protein